MRKLMLAIGMLDRPELIIMDEPTNHLDLHSTEARRSARSRRSPGALLLVSHDHAFLKACTDRIWEVRGGIVSGSVIEGSAATRPKASAPRTTRLRAVALPGAVDSPYAAALPLATRRYSAVPRLGMVSRLTSTPSWRSSQSLRSMPPA